MNAAPCSCRAGTTCMRASNKASVSANVSSPGTPKMTRTPSCSRHCTSNVAAFMRPSLPCRPFFLRTSWCDPAGHRRFSLYDRVAWMDEGLERNWVTRVLLHQSGMQLFHGFDKYGHPLIVERHEDELFFIVRGIRHRDRAGFAAAAHPVNHGVPRNCQIAENKHHLIFVLLPAHNRQHLHDHSSSAIPPYSAFLLR